jgi:tetratricopeptide (TPR) repeat protein
MCARGACRLLALAILAALPLTAHAAISVFGTPEAVKCYERAEAGSTQTDVCDAALKNPDLLERDRASTLVNRGIIYNNAGKIAQALADFEAALAIDTNIPEAYLNRGNSRFFQNRLNDAIADYTRAIDLKIARLAAAYYNRGLAYADMGRLTEAKADFEAAAAADPDFKDAKDQLAVVNRLLANPGAAPPGPPPAPK